MTKLICTMPVRYGELCGGEVIRKEVLFCLKCKNVQNLKAKKCTKCGGELIKAKEYICKECKGTPNFIEV